MSRIAAQQGMTPSLLDRLLDPESEGTAWRSGYGLEEMMEVVRRDVESLLNTHRPGTPIPAARHRRDGESRSPSRQGPRECCRIQAREEKSLPVLNSRKPGDLP